MHIKRKQLVDKSIDTKRICTWIIVQFILVVVRSCSFSLLYVIIKSLSFGPKKQSVYHFLMFIEQMINHKNNRQTDHGNDRDSSNCILYLQSHLFSTSRAGR